MRGPMQGAGPSPPGCSADGLVGDALPGEGSVVGVFTLARAQDVHSAGWGSEPPRAPAGILRKALASALYVGACECPSPRCSYT